MIKQKILETAHDSFYKYGFHACGVELLARQSGTTKRTLYAHFGNKDGLIEAVLNYRHTKFMQHLAKFIGDAPAKETIKGYLKFLQSWIESKDFYGCMFINACGEFSSQDATAHKIAQQHKQQIIDYLHQHLNNLEVAKLLFLYGEGLIVSSQTNALSTSDNHKSLIQFLNSQL